MVYTEHGYFKDHNRCDYDTNVDKTDMIIFKQ